MNEAEFVEVAAARDLQHAHILVAILKDAGTEGRVGNEHLQDVIGTVPMGYATSPRILVARSEPSRAQKVLEDAEPDREE